MSKSSGVQWRSWDSHGRHLRHRGSDRPRAKDREDEAVLARIAARQLPVTIPAVVVAEWYRGQRDWRRVLALAKRIEPMTEPLARLAGAALEATAGDNAVDAIVIACAAQRGDVVYTSDVPDLQVLAGVFPEVRILGA